VHYPVEAVTVTAVSPRCAVEPGPLLQQVQTQYAPCIR
jgi:hypothetical protein